MAQDPSLIGSVLNALPMDKMIAGPLQAMIQAQVQASRAYADFLLSVCVQDGKAVYVQFSYDETLVDANGTVRGVQQKEMRIPLIAAISHPVITIEEGRIDFELQVSQAGMTQTETADEGNLDAKLGWGPFSVAVSGRVTHKSEQTRKTDTSAKYSIHTQVKRQDPPEALMRVIDFLTDAATKPVVLPANVDKLGEFPQPSRPAADAGNTPKPLVPGHIGPDSPL